MGHDRCWRYDKEVWGISGLDIYDLLLLTFLSQNRLETVRVMAY